MAKSRDIECRDFRERFEGRLSPGNELSEGEIRVIEAHREECITCQQWASATEDLIAKVSSMPQFDVPEAVTQRIMQSVNAQPAYGDHLARVLFFVVGALVAFLVFESGESLAGLLSWAIGLGLMGSLKFLFGGTQEARVTGQ
ncbi:MAG TPA: hypothetical protein V6D17_01615 [Candidatus Obscuribacterales bacterium]